MSPEKSEKLIERQIDRWNQLRELLKEDSNDSAQPPGGPVITVSRLIGSGGRTLATALADCLGLELQDQSLLETIAQDKNLARSLIPPAQKAGAAPSDLWLRGVLNQRIFLRDQFHGALAETVCRLAARGGLVFLGRGAHLILRERATLRIRVIASQQTRLARIRTQLEVSRAEARAILMETERQRERFVREVFKEEIARAEHFDLTINTDRLDPESALEMVLVALLERLADKAGHGDEPTPPQARNATA